MALRSQKARTRAVKKAVRNYRKEYLRDHASTKAKRDRAARNGKRGKAMREGRVAKGDGKEIDHIVPLSKGGSNSDSNTRVVSRRTNRTKAAKVT